MPNNNYFAGEQYKSTQRKIRKYKGKLGNLDPYSNNYDKQKAKLEERIAREKDNLYVINTQLKNPQTTSQSVSNKTIATNIQIIGVQNNTGSKPKKKSNIKPKKKGK